MDQAVEDTIKSCSACVLNQPLNKYTPLQTTPLPHGPWVKGAVDLIGPMDDEYILTYIDYCSSYPEARVLKEITSCDVIKALADIFLRFWVSRRNCFRQRQTIHKCRIQSFIKIVWNQAYPRITILFTQQQ